MTHEVVQIPRSQIEAGKNDRKFFDDVGIAHLAVSIDKRGLLQPPTVRPIGRMADGGMLYEIVAGERRIRAMDVLGWTLIPCLVRELDDEEASALMLLENTARVDLDPMSEANAYNVRVQRFSWSPEQIALTAGVSADLVKDRLKLLRLTPDVQHFVRTRALPIGHAMQLVDLDINRQRIALSVFNSAASMPLAGFKDVVAKLQADQDDESQMGLFALELQMIEEAQADAAQVTRGKAARTGAPISKRLPRVRVKMRDSVGDILDRYITDLLSQGEGESAAAIGNIYNTLVAFNWVSVPVNSVLVKTSDVTGTAGEIAPVAIM